MFQGFSVNTTGYLMKLKKNNNKQWFEANRDKYNKFLIEPMQDLVKDLTPAMLSIDPLFDANPKKVISRINRDLRFAKDKSPYKTNMWLAFKKTYQDWKTEPTYFFEISQDSYRYGMGFYSIPKDALIKLRNMIDKNDKDFKKIQALYKNQKTFSLEGEKYKRIINPGLSEELNEWYQRKDLYFVCNRKIDKRIYSPLLKDDLTEGFLKLVPIYNFFLKLRD